MKNIMSINGPKRNSPTNDYLLMSSVTKINGLNGIESIFKIKKQK
jgi:hypothetical protein